MVFDRGTNDSHFHLTIKSDWCMKVEDKKMSETGGRRIKSRKGSQFWPYVTNVGLKCPDEDINQPG